MVPSGWLTNDQFLAGYGAAQALPGPMFAFAAYLGAAMSGVLGGAKGWPALDCLGEHMDSHETRRLNALLDYRVLDTPPEEAFDNITQLAAAIFRTPIVLVSLIDSERQWFKSRVGLDSTELPREAAFCDHAVRAGSTLVVEDATRDDRFVHNPLVIGAPFIRFYCGVPLRSPEGLGLGTLCLIDRTARTISLEQRGALESLARQVETELELRRRLLALEEALEGTRAHQRAKELLASMVVHDLRSPLTSITLIAASLQSADPEFQGPLDDLAAEAARAKAMLTDVLDLCLHGLGRLRLRRATFDVHRLIREVVRGVDRRAKTRGQTIVVDLPTTPEQLDADPELIRRVLENLLNNAMHHGPPNQPIKVASGRRPEGLRIEVRDFGAPIGAQGRQTVFQAFEIQPGPGAQRPSGLGLSFCAMAVQAHGGTIGLEPSEEGGNCFFFVLQTVLAAATG